jgi:Na+(H+)/acetate symporter ActP
VWVRNKICSDFEDKMNKRWRVRPWRCINICGADFYLFRSLRSCAIIYFARRTKSAAGYYAAGVQFTGESMVLALPAIIFQPLSLNLWYDCISGYDGSILYLISCRLGCGSI